MSLVTSFSLSSIPSFIYRLCHSSTTVLLISSSLQVTKKMDHDHQLQLGLTLKRSFDDEASSKSTLELPVPPVPKQRKLLPLFVWNNKKEIEEGNSSSVVVGWPPVKSWNKKLINNGNHKHYYDQDHGCVINVDDDNNDNNRRKMFVKVSMEGMPIGRKIDLSVYHSYQSLTTAILSMFGKYYEQRSVKEGDNKGNNYTLTYLDKEGDWLLVGDVPWKSFIESVQRLKIIKNNSF